MRFDRHALLAGLLLGLAVAGATYAASVDQIWNSVYDSTNRAIRLNIVAP